MPLNPVTGGLHRLKNDSHDVAKVAIAIPAGDEVEVSEVVAGQLGEQGNFRDPDDVPEPAPQVVRDENGEIDVEASDPDALAAAGVVAPAVKAAPVKKAPKRAAPKAKAG